MKKTVKPDKWEKSLIAVTHTFSSVDAWEIERFGYKKAKLTSKVRVLKVCMLRFHINHNIKKIINKLLFRNFLKCSLIIMSNSKTK